LLSNYAVSIEKNSGDVRMINEYRAVTGMGIGRGNRIIRRKPAPVPLCPPKILHDLTEYRSRAAAVGSRRLKEDELGRKQLLIEILV
jgi:hypothetical protein